jgi:hypothetical protein
MNKAAKILMVGTITAELLAMPCPASIAKIVWAEAHLTAPPAYYVATSTGESGVHDDCGNYVAIVSRTAWHYASDVRSIDTDSTRV